MHVVFLATDDITADSPQTGWTIGPRLLLDANVASAGRYGRLNGVGSDRQASRRPVRLATMEGPTVGASATTQAPGPSANTA